MSKTKRKQQADTKKIIIVLIVVVIVLFALFLGLRYLKSKINERFADPTEASAESAEVTVGSISTTVYGKGTLANEDSETITLPSTVEVTKIYVSTGDDIASGDLLASVNASTVLQAMAEKQSEIDALDEELSEISDDSLDESLTAAVSGRVKKILAAEGDDVTDVMVQNNALLLISLDGFMAVRLDTADLQRRESVTVTTDDGTSYDGSVSTVSGGSATILITDDGPLYGESVTVTDAEGNEIGSGELTIHEPVSVTGFAGTISEVLVSENEEIEAGDTLFTLTDVSYSANYATLLSERADLEEELQDLMTVYLEGGVYAHSAGTITAVSEGTYTEAKTSTASDNGFNSAFGFTGNSTSSSSDSASDGADTTISYCPNETMEVSISVDESDILSITEGQEVQVYISSLSDEAYTGTVTEIGTTGTSSNGVTSYTVSIQVAKEEGMLSGMTATAYVTIEGTDNALLIPLEALNITSTTAYVYTSYNEETDELGDMVEVETGLKNSNYAEIKSGLSEGDTVYYKEETEENNPFGNMPGGNFDFNGGSNPFESGDMPGGNTPGGSGNMPGGSGSMPGGFGN